MNNIQNTLDEVITQYRKEHQKEINLTNRSSIDSKTVSLSSRQPILTKLPTKKDTIDKISTIIRDTISKYVKMGMLSLKNNALLEGIEIKGFPQINTLVYDSRSMDLLELNHKIQTKLNRRHYYIKYNLLNVLNGAIIDSLIQEPIVSSMLSARSSVSMTPKTYIEIRYTNPLFSSLMKGLKGIFLSLILCLVIILTLYYLLYIIRKQKRISEIKQDFISNITHEFKTPIATIYSAVEAIKNFSDTDKPEKTKRYLDISIQQLKKLDFLVEKVIETSLLESDALVLQKQDNDVIKILESCTERYNRTTEKIITFESNINQQKLAIDKFHFENAFSNLLDNAIKYGGDKIKVSIQENEHSLRISVSDNGKGIDKEAAPHIFEKFYRISNHNIHNIKGFGIGLYYTKNIIEKHGGTITLENKNAFIVILWRK